MIDVVDQILRYIDDGIETAVIDNAADVLELTVSAMDDGRPAHRYAMQIDLRIIIEFVDQVHPLGNITLIMFGKPRYLPSDLPWARSFSKRIVEPLSR